MNRPAEGVRHLLVSGVPADHRRRAGPGGAAGAAGAPAGRRQRVTRMPVPILLVCGFLGAGKTSVVNHLLAHAEGRRIAAVVNDFGAINIDAELIAGACDGVVSLSNGCICCSLEGDLLRVLSALLRRDATAGVHRDRDQRGGRSGGDRAQPDGPGDLAGGAAGDGAVRGGRLGAGGVAGRSAAAVAVARGRRGGAEQAGPRGRFRTRDECARR